MRLPTRIHGMLDYMVGALLIALPFLLGFGGGAQTWVPVALGAAAIVYSLFTDYELGVWRTVPMSVHNLFDVAAGALLAASPWIFGFADEGANVWAPLVVVGLAAIFLGLTTKQRGGYSYRKRGADTSTTAAG